MVSLSDVSTPHRVGDGYRLEVPIGWRQGRGAFGGLIVGALVRAIEDRIADPGRKVRSVTAELPGPVDIGDAEIAVETLRRGNNVSTVRAALSQHGEIRSHVVAVAAAARSAGATGQTTWNDLSPPAAPRWTDIAPFDVPRQSVFVPEFAQHFEYWLVEGLPVSGGAARAVGWVRPRDPGPDRGAAYIAAMIDSWWPAAMNRVTAMRPMATIAFTLDIAGGADGLDPAAPLLYRAITPVCSDGYAFETRELWSEDGRLVAVNHQTFVVIR